MCAAGIAGQAVADWTVQVGRQHRGRDHLTLPSPPLTITPPRKYQHPSSTPDTLTLSLSLALCLSLSILPSSQPDLSSSALSTSHAFLPQPQPWPSALAASDGPSLSTTSSLGLFQKLFPQLLFSFFATSLETPVRVVLCVIGASVALRPRGLCTLLTGGEDYLSP